MSYSAGASFGALPAVSQTVTVTKSSVKSVPSRGGVSAGAGGGGQSGVVGGTSTVPPATRASGTFITEADKPDVIRSRSPEEQKRAELQSKFHPSVLAVIDRLKATNPIAGADESKFIHNGKAEVQIWFTDKSAEAMARLKELGFEVILDPKTAKMVIGRLPIEKLAALADIKSIRYVAPQVSTN
jgi:hypothetical protein